MPELPEVEVIKLGLQKKIIGSKITKIQVLSGKSFIGNPNLAIGQKVLNVWRRAKILGINLDGNTTLLFHLKMSGQLIFIPNDKQLTINDKRFIGGHPTEDMMGKMPNVHTRVIFSFADGSHLYFNDLRKFGWVRIVTSTEVISNKLLKDLGPEPLEKGFTWQILKNNLLKHKTQVVKVALMNQTVVAGIGNIYASETLFDAKIDPRKRVNELQDKEFQQLHQGILKALKDGIKHGGSTRANFVDAEGHRGYFLDYAYVYGRDKYKCKICGGEIKKIQQAGRGTYLCPSCQR
ncbi:bifunctional DNA-formamidopyrimidine glycosylase/DNA-(apurinic or apyrimidinic site) lyase [Candidatus Daviesbacteria bacterium]|nr:bifunctional DNA-formamidopyrimidine glycosylase/DNA-(apurinic or apyrimidinic site) lyase [Candidatus Daviesbacteria bacterium]